MRGKRNMIKQCDIILPVSFFTKEKMKQIHHLPEEKFTVINNCLDPFLPIATNTGKDERLLNKYGFTKDNILLMTLTRLSAKEQYKGYDKVVIAMKELISAFPHLRYLIVGKYDKEEKARLDKIINDNGLGHAVVYAGFIPDEELASHYNLADIYIMPSKEEGFGIVFIEAMFYGLPVIAGNKDGSADALRNGELGLLVDPENITEIRDAIKKIISNHTAFVPNREKLMNNFSFTVYKNNLKAVVLQLYN